VGEWGGTKVPVSVLSLYCKELFFAVLGFELRTFTLSHSISPIFVMGFFKIRSGELVAQAGFEP
jgi:hypothetical protein